MRSRSALLVASMAAAAGVSMLAGCPQQCRRTHNELQLIPQYAQVCAGTTCTMQLSHFLPITVAVCDEWADSSARASSALTH